MKIVFAGPSLSKSRILPDTIEFRGPAFQRDVFNAVQDGANVIGIVDGFFESVSSVWHKEILYALSQGVQVLGAASMGALRAAECADFGMIGVGEIFKAFVEGRLLDDDAVAVTHAPPELGYMPLTIPLVNVVWTLADWVDHGYVNNVEASIIEGSARSVYFKDRTWREIFELAKLSPARISTLLELAKTEQVDRKALDAEMLVREVEARPDRKESPPSWEFSRTDQFLRFIAGPQSKSSLSRGCNAVTLYPFDIPENSGHT